MRSETSLIQTMGLAARNVEGKVILYSAKDKNGELTITGSMKRAFEITEYRRGKQEAYNKAHNITPKGVSRNVEAELKIESSGLSHLYESGRKKGIKIPKSERESIIKELKKQMLEAAKNLEFEEAARLRDEIARIKAM